MGFKCEILSFIILLFIPGSVGERISVSCKPQTICALQDSEVNLTCSYSNTNIRTVFWFNSKQKDKWKNQDHPEDLTLHSDCAEQVTTKTTSSNSTLTIRDLREGDSGDYQLMIITDDGVKHQSSPAVRLTVMVLQVKENREKLTCRTSCSLTSGTHSYKWYKNGGEVFGIGGDKGSLTLSHLTAGSYSCSVSSHTEIHSNAVCEY
ncbi:uncharacterized protein LOC125787117 [Astyanax mexicanus]|uniref:uncharacterized protein LOC125787117 n=1 Tax=Astyanax mexicanus TaxID=7994 RepID=UPI0020CAE6FC|nr:uncharacterized protein LOC125787117 [Astyanax mexicanus]